MLKEILFYFLFIIPLVVYFSGIYRAKTQRMMLSIAAFVLVSTFIILFEEIPAPARWILLSVILLTLLYHLIVPILLKTGVIKGMDRSTPPAREMSPGSSNIQTG